MTQSSISSTSRRIGFRHQRGTGGFSLIEVVLSLAIIAVAFIPLVGLMPRGLDASRQAIDTTLEAQIVQQMSSQALQTDFSKLSSLHSTTPTCFDGNGNVTTTSSGLYMASFGTPANTTLPGGSVTQKLDTITIYVLSTRTTGGTVIQDPSLNTSAHKFIVYVADNGR